jgi:hypothetical protein
MGGRLSPEQVLSSGGDSQSGEYLQGKTLTDYFEGTERPAFVLTNESRGITHVDGDEERMVRPGTGCSAVAAITDERVLLVVGGNEEGAGRNRDVSLPYTEIRSVDSKRGMLKSRLTITARTSDTYHFVVRGREDLDEVAAFVERAISHWVALERRLEDARDHIATIESYVEAGEPEAASEAYKRTRELIRDARDIAAEFQDREDAMHRRIDQLATRLKLSEIRGHRTRAAQLVEEAEEARDADDYAAALDSYRAAKDQCEQGVELPGDVEYHEADETEMSVAQIDRAIEELRTQPLVTAMDACAAAQDATEPAPEAWSEALEQCHESLGLLLGHPDRFDGDADALRMQVEWAAGNLLDADRRAAKGAESRGDDHRSADDHDAAREAYETARSYLQEARSVAAEFRTGSTEAIDEALARLDGKLADLD